MTTLLTLMLSLECPAFVVTLILSFVHLALSCCPCICPYVCPWYDLGAEVTHEGWHGHGHHVLATGLHYCVLGAKVGEVCLVWSKNCMVWRLQVLHYYGHS